MKIHELKLENKYFNKVKSGVKKFEIRKNDRDFKVGDLLSLSRFENGSYQKWFCGIESAGYKQVSIHEADTIMAKVTYITDYEQKDGYVVMGIELN